jgi:hypothetical protein
MTRINQSLEAIMAHSVSLNWTASTDAVDGYNVYRGTAAGQETTKINSSLVSGTSLVDASPLLGNDFYVARSVKNGVESINSNEANAVILPAAPTALVISAQS